MATTKVITKRTVKKTVSAHPAAAETGLKAAVVGVDGKAAGSIMLPEKYFGAKPNKQLIAQSVRVYLANQRAGHAATKTRGMVEGSTKKIYKQKGTGRARHGAIRAPIFVGGGIVFGPMPRDYSLKMPPKMKRAALASALSQKFTDKDIIVVSGLSDIEPKTKLMARMLKAVGATKSTLLVTAKDAAHVVRAGRNIAGVDTVPVTDMYAYGVISHQKIVFMKEAIKSL